MLRVFDSGRARWVRTVVIVTVLVALVTTGLVGALGFVASPRAVAPTGSHLTPAIAPTHPGGNVLAPSHAASAGAFSHADATPSTTVPFWGNNTTFANNNATARPTSGPACYAYGFSFPGYNFSYHDCYGGFTNPTAVHLANGKLGVGYDVSTNLTPPACPTQVGNESNYVAFATSSDGGTTFSNPVNVSVGSSCSDFNAIEPSFTVSSSGIVYGTWVTDSFTDPQGQFRYTDRSTDGLVFAKSTNNGGSFGAAVSINSLGNIARPQIVSYGTSLYVLYENITNTTTTTLSYGNYGSGAYPIALDLLYSSNGGLTWSGPYTLPGWNATDGYTAFGGWLQVNLNGELGVSYFTNQHCVAVYYGYCYDHGDDLVFATSVTNGTSWSTPFVVQPDVGENYEYAGWFYLPAYFQVVPHSQFVFSADGATAYVVFDGNFNKSSPYAYYNYQNSGVFSAVGSVTGTGWTTSRIAAWLDTSNYDSAYNPSIAWVGTKLYTTFTWFNDTYCYGSSCPLNEYTYTQYQTSSTDGLTWESPATLDLDSKTAACGGYYCFQDFFGFTSSVVAYNSTHPVFAYTLGVPYTFTFNYFYTGSGYNYYYNYSYMDRLEVSFPYAGPTVSVNFTEQNLPVGTNWSFTLNGHVVATTSSSITVTDIPYNVTVTVFANNVPSGYNEIISPDQGVSLEQTFTSSTTLTFNYSVQYGLQIYFKPNTVPYIYVETFVGGSSTGDYFFGDCGVPCTYTPYFAAYPSMPWYFAIGTVVTIEVLGFEGVPPSYWNGTGPGSYNGTGLWANVTMNAPLNETMWWGSIGAYDVQVNPIGLTSASTYSFTVDGTTYSALGDASVTLPGLLTGAHTITSISATSSTSGWGYVGYSTPASPFVVPLDPIVNLSFAYIHLTAPTGTVTFQAQGLTAGTVWQFGFNGTTYSSDTPWINVTTRPGTFPVLAFPVTSMNSSVGYTPTGVSKTMSVTTGSTYTIDFVQAYNVRVTASTGGSVSGGSSVWLAAGATASFVASAHANYAFGGWTGSGLGSYTGTNATAMITANGPITESAAFYPLPGSRFNLTFTETGLAPGTWWSVFLGGTGYSSNQSTFVVGNLLACSSPGSNYPLSIPYAYSSDGLTRYIPTSHLSATICTTGTTTVLEAFAPQYLLTLQSTEGGYAQATVGTATFTNSVWVASGATVILDAVAQTGYIFLGWNGTGLGSFTGPGPVAQDTIVVAGPITELASFALPVKPVAAVYSLDFHLATALATGTSWSLTLNGTGYSSTGTDLIVAGLHAGGPLTLSVSNAVAPDGLTEYAPVGIQPTVTVSHNQTIVLSFSTSFWVSISSTAGGATHPTSAWITSGATILLNATPNDGFDFVGWTGTGSGSFTGTSQSYTVKVNSPITEVATFTPHLVPVTTTTTTTSSIWTNPITWAGLAVAGLLVGLVIGLILARRRAPPSAPVAEAPATTEPDSATMSEGTQ